MMKDLFSDHSSSYAAFRPTYPSPLYEFILSNTAGRDVAWDCACGNGQVAKDLSPHFKVVHATDISQKQLGNAFPRHNIQYSVSAAESTSFPDQTFDLITVGQALHWFRIQDFFREISRVGKKGGTIAVWGYGLLSINKEIDPIMNDFYVKTVGPYWDPERKLIDEHYRSVDFPFKQIATPKFEFSFVWTLAELLGYLSTWSAVQKFIVDNSHNPIEELSAKLVHVWRQERVKVSFPLFVKVGVI